MRPRVQEKLDQLKQLDEEIIALLSTETELAEEIDEARAPLLAALVNIDMHCSPDASAPSPVRPTGSRPVAITMPTHNVKLPKLTICPFNGDLTSWTSFWDSYLATIHENTRLSEIDKFINYLRSFLEHSALEAISGFTLTAANYREAVQILEKRYGNKQQIVSKHMDALLNVDTVTSPNNVKGLRHLFDFVESHIRSLNSLGVTSDSYGTLLTSVILNKLPQELQLLISRKIGDDDWTLTKLMDHVGEEVRAQERTSAVTIGQKAVRKSGRKEPFTGAALLTGSGPTCSFCRQSHTSNPTKNSLQGLAMICVKILQGSSSKIL